MYQHDPTHVDVLVKDLGLEHGNSVQTPATRDVTEEEPEPSDQVQHSKYRSQVARCLFLSQTRADKTLIVNELRQRLVRYLKRQRQWWNIFSYGRMVEEVTKISDSDWAGCKETRKSSSAGVILLGKPHPESVHAQATDPCKKQC